MKEKIIVPEFVKTLNFTNWTGLILITGCKEINFLSDFLISQVYILLFHPIIIKYSSVI